MKKEREESTEPLYIKLMFVWYSGDGVRVGKLKVGGFIAK